MNTVDAAFWRDHSVLLTGHTGFKGSWLTLWLHALGARVHGYALDPPTEPSLFEAASVRAALASDTRAPLADLPALTAAVARAEPRVVFHLAAQPLVRESYRTPLATLETNVLGSAHVLEAVRGVASVQAVVVVTTDKVYENNESVYPYRESDPLGGRDPYSASKAAAEIVVASYRASFFENSAAHIATARAGNVFGGGDWAAERLIPDCMRAFAQGQTVQLRRPDSVRPWQHVLEPLSGYLLLAQALCGPSGARYARAWNFGPDPGGDASVGTVAAFAAKAWGGDAQAVLPATAAGPHEAALLRLDNTRARVELGWRPRWALPDALQKTIEWHRVHLRGGDVRALCLQQIAAYAAVMANG